MESRFVYLLSVVTMKYYYPEDPGYVSVWISGYQNTNIQYLLPWENVDRNVSLEAQTNWTWSAIWRLTETQEEACTTKPLKVASSEKVNIQVSRGKISVTFATEYTGLPLTRESKEFLLSSQPTTSSSLGDQIYVVGAAEGGANIRVFVNNTGNEKADFLYSIRLSPYEMLQTSGGHVNLTGLYLKSDRPIVVYSGHQCGNVPVGVRYCDPLYQQIPPLSSIGKDYIMGPIRQRDEAGYTARVIFARANSIVNLFVVDGHLELEKANLAGCTLLTVTDGHRVQCESPLAVGSYVDVLVTPSTSPLRVECSAPCYVYQLNHGGTEPQHGVLSDPFMALVAPLERYASDIRFSTVSSYTNGHELLFRNFVTIIARRSATVLLDDNVLQPENAITIGDYKVYSSEIQHGFHRVRIPDNRFTNLVVQVYGHGPPYNFSGSHAYGMAGTFPATQTEDSVTYPDTEMTSATILYNTSPVSRKTSLVLSKTTQTEDSVTYPDTEMTSATILYNTSPVSRKTSLVLSKTVIIVSSVIAVIAVIIISAIVIGVICSKKRHQSHQPNTTDKLNIATVEDLKSTESDTGVYCELFDRQSVDDLKQNQTDIYLSTGQQWDVPGDDDNYERIKTL